MVENTESTIPGSGAAVLKAARDALVSLITTGAVALLAPADDPKVQELLMGHYVSLVEMEFLLAGLANMFPNLTTEAFGMFFEVQVLKDSVTESLNEQGIYPIEIEL